jgi:hypothetical protein
MAVIKIIPGGLYAIVSRLNCLASALSFYFQYHFLLVIALPHLEEN